MAVSVPVVSLEDNHAMKKINKDWNMTKEVSLPWYRIYMCASPPVQRQIMNSFVPLPIKYPKLKVKASISDAGKHAVGHRHRGPFSRLLLAKQMETPTLLHSLASRTQAVAFLLCCLPPVI